MQVLLGRATEDVIVDIDLGREGSGNKISRRQVDLIQFLFQIKYINIENVVAIFFFSCVQIFACLFFSCSKSVLMETDESYSLSRQL